MASVQATKEELKLVLVDPKAGELGMLLVDMTPLGDDRGPATSNANARERLKMRGGNRSACERLLSTTNVRKSGLLSNEEEAKPLILVIVKRKATLGGG